MEFELPEKIEVKDHHILEGCQCSPYTCPIALAFWEFLGLNSSNVVSVNTTEVSLYKFMVGWKSIKFGSKVKRWIMKFDLSEELIEVNPIKLVLKKNSSGNQYYDLGE